MRAPSYLPLPDLPTLLAGEDRHRLRRRHRLILVQRERWIEELVEPRARDAEGRAALVVVEKKETGEEAPGAHHLRDARAPVGPAAARERTEKRALIDEVEGCLVEREEIRLPYGQRKPARAAERRLREIDAEHVVAVFREVLHFVAGAAAGN